MIAPILLSLVALGVIITPAYAQTIPVNQTDPCFLNYTAGYKIFDDCGFDEDWMSASLIGFEWVTGGYFSFLLLGVIVMMTYIKYHKVLYPLLIGVLYLPVVWTLVPSEFWLYLILLAGAGIIFSIWKIVKNQTSEFN